MNAPTRIAHVRTKGPSFAGIAETERQQRVTASLKTLSEMYADKHLRSPEL